MAAGKQVWIALCHHVKFSFVCVYILQRLCVCMHVTFALPPPRLSEATVAFTGVRSFCVDAFTILALVGHATLINVCQFERKPRKMEKKVTIVFHCNN